ncbi:amino acid adenylation domain-containing protein [Kitasatospora sp. NPDC058063]|uniref:amino acid adenylation domain-containing protein n=1 Tax=unclassified Kitasatospora TaxID=2633591 RepID=UPI0036DB3BE2
MTDSFDGRIVLLDGDSREQIATRPATAPATTVTPDNLIYVIYTSGSTGKPKGVSLTHANVLRLYSATREQFAFGADDVFTQAHSYAFDVSVWEMWGALLHGGRVVVVPTDVNRSPGELLDLLVAEQVTVMLQTPTGFRALAALAGDGDPRIDQLDLRLVGFGGEKLETSELQPWVDRMGLDRPALVNLYGPTETTMHCAYHRIGAEDIRRPSRSNIGRPLRDLSVHLLDAHGRLVPVGVPGEIHVGGPALALGYLDRPEMTAEKFVPNPFGPAGSRLYRTGDLARRLPDGSLDFLGRVDTQVKIRGYRIELGEIETALRRHPAVRAAVVTVIEGAQGAKQLVGYYVPQQGAAPAAAQLREHLAADLPAYMVPTAFVAIDAIPLTSNGKLDHRALPAPDQASFATVEHVAPRTPVEERLAVIWSDVLGVARVGVEDSFFDLGGDSIRAVRLVGALRTAGYDVSIRDVFESRTIAAMAAGLTGQGGESLVKAVEPFALIGEEDRAALPEGVVDAYPLSQIQTGMLVETMAAGPADRAVYHNLNSFRIRDDQPFSLPVFQQAVDVVVQRHDILRTSMHLSGYALPLQLVHATADYPVTLWNLRGLDIEEQERRKAAYLTQERAVVFDLTAAPLLRMSVLAESDGSWRLNFTYHHAVSEGWSYNALMMELVECYQHLRDGRELPAYEAPAVRFADFVAAELESLASEEDRAFWQDVVAEHAPLRLPEPWAAPERDPQDRHGLRVPFHDLEEGLRTLAARAGTSLKSVLLAAHLKVLGSVTPDQAFHTGVVYHGRLEAPGAERVLGMHLNTLPFPATRPSGTWRELVERVFAQEAEIWAHRRYPLPAVQRDSGTRERLLTVMFEYLDFHHVDGETVDTDAGFNDGFNEFALNVVPNNGHLNMATSGEFLSREALGRLAGMYRLVLEAMAADPDGDASGAVLAEAERAALVRGGSVVEWGAGSALELFRARAAAAPDAVAVVFGEERVSYGELDAWSSRIAGRLRGQGVGAGSVVGLYLDRGPGVLAAMLGVWKAGAAYLPVDPSLPAERVGYMLTDSGAALVLTDADPAGQLGEYTGPWLELAGGSEESWDGIVPAVDELAYVLYTSGSTGRPKGVMIGHGALVNLLGSIRDDVTPGAPGTWLASTSVSFDISGLELHLPLISGGTIVLASAEQAKDATALVELVARNEVTHVQATPSGWRLLLAAGFDNYAVTALVGGEALTAGLARELLPQVDRLVNVYGPTETTIWSAQGEVPEGVERVSIGGPLANTRLHVLDVDLNPVPQGVTGELFIGGDGLARGYLGRPDLTAEKFVPNPFGPAGSRLYATGDLARVLADGTLECLGRADGQVKVRGYRIELGEIESALREHAWVRDAVVTAQEDAHGDKSLVAYVVSADGSGLDTVALREFLSRSLPEYMVPAAFMELAAIPLTNSGKVDHKALPAVDQSAFATAEIVAPRTPLEERLVAVWSDVLGVARVGVEDSFFELGGDSIRVVRLVGALRATGYDVDVRSVYQHGTIAELGTYISGKEVGGSLVTAVEPFALIGAEDRALLPVGVVDAYPLSQIQTGMLVEMVAAQERGESAYLNISSFRIPDAESFDAAAFTEAAAVVAGRHEALRTSMHLSGYSQPMQLVHADTQVPVALHDLRGLDSTQQIKALRAFSVKEHAAAFDLGTAPLLRIAIHLESDEAWRLTFTYNHAIAEGWSYHSLLMELLASYQHLRDGRELPAYEAPAVRFADFVAAELESLASEEDRAFWQGIVDNHAPAQLPDSWADPATAGAREPLGTDVAFGDLEDGLRTLAARARTSLKSVLLAAHLKVLGMLSAEEAIHAGVVYHGRLEAPGAERVLGMHLNTLPFPATRPSGTWRQLVEQVFAQEAETWAHRRYPLPAVQRDSGQSGRLIAVLFEYLDFHQVDTETVDMAGNLNVGGNEFALNVAAIGRRIMLNTTSDVVGREALGRLAGMYRLVLEAMAADPDGDASGVVLAEAERAALVRGGSSVEWGAGSALELFRARAAAAPDAVAVVFGEERVSYGELDAESSRIAGRLRGRGVGSGSVVGLYLDRGPGVVAAMLGVWKAGAAYVPVDPSLPAERVGYMLTDSGAALVLTDADPAGRLGEYAGPWLELAGGSEESWDGIVPASDDLAYVLYTSGSTGRPKGVMIGQGALVNLLGSIRDDVTGDNAGTWLASTSVSFDISGLELHLPLISGGTIVLASAEQAKDATALVELVARNEVTHVQATPSGWRLLLAAGFDDVSVTALVGGEALTVGVARELLPKVGRLVNVYGPTETTIWSARGEVPAEVERVSIGGPLANTQLFVLDGALELVPQGVTGELFIGGDGLARGYLGRPDLTAEKFVPNPFGPAGSRLYATGDLARVLADGTLECLGRADGQVKVRGYRIELGEIESALREHTSVRDAVVTAQEDAHGDKSLVAYLVPAGGSGLDTAALREFLSRSLPEYMVPAVFVTLDAIPLTNSGKVDHKALPASATTALSRAAYVAPRTMVEEQLAAIWSDVLGIDRIGVEDSFFELGGDSIRALRMLSAGREAGLPLAVWMVMQAKNLRELAALAQGDGGRTPEQDGIALLAEQHRLLGAQATGGRTVQLPVNGQADADVLEEALRAVVQHHQALRLRFDEAADGRAHLAEPNTEALVHVVDLGEVPAAERSARIERAVVEGRARLDTRGGSLVDATLIRFGAESGAADQIWLTVHELAVDRASWTVLVEDLNTAYRQLNEGLPATLPPVASPLHWWAEQKLKQAHSDELLDQAELWLDRPKGAALPVDRARVETTHATANTVTATLPSELTASLLADANPEHLVLTAVGRTLARWAQADRIAVEIAGDARGGATADTAGDPSRTVGPLDHGYPVTLRLPLGRDAQSSLKSVARQMRTLPDPVQGYGLLRHLAPDPEVAEELAALPAPEARFSFTAPRSAAGRPTARSLNGTPPLVYLAERVVATAAPEAPRAHLLEIDAYVYEGRLYVEWVHSTDVHEAATVRRLVDEQMAELRVLLGEDDGTDAASGRRPVRRSSRSSAAESVLADLRAEEVMADHAIPGASLALIHDGQVTAVRSYGVLGAGESEPVTPDTLFAVGSISKHVTTYAALGLVSQGLLDLDRDVNRYLTSWQVPGEFREPVTARLLMANLAGFAPHPAVNEGHYPDDDEQPTVLDMLYGRAPAKTPPVRRQDVPGQVFRQNSVHYSVLQQVMSDLTGEAFPDLVKRLVFTPLGMTGSSFDPMFPHASGRPFARGHDVVGTQVRGGYIVQPEPAAAGMWSTAEDLARFAVEIRRGYLGYSDGLVDQQLVRQMLSPQSDRNYGWSTIVDTTSGDVEFGHGGQAYGYQAMTGLRVHSGVGSVLLTNAVSGRELVKHMIVATWSARTRVAGLWQKAIDEAVQQERARAAVAGQHR